MAKARDTSRLNVIYNNLRMLAGRQGSMGLEDQDCHGNRCEQHLSVLNPYLRYGSAGSSGQRDLCGEPGGSSVEADLPAATSLGTYGPGAVITHSSI